MSDADERPALDDPGAYTVDVPSELLTGKPRRRRRWLLVGAMVGLVLVLSGVAGAAGYLAFSNGDRADMWEGRATELEASLAEANAGLGERTQELNDRVEDLNRMAGKVSEFDEALARSEGDVKTLERRQRQLANEKARIEDERAQLEVEQATLLDQQDALLAQQDALFEVANASVACSDGLSLVVDALAFEDYIWLEANYSSIAADCAHAQDQIDSYNASYGI